ncbi:OmpA family protein [Aestuariispira insulae]|uniref:Outer membrane protein OmpA-like peptidoglycan-associated protein n=1 Tax=Aestuariispira insulae TaxID=1461337 RepID=A0A3D9HK11_9PROT|nr:OmpA family protein [Aestuariispira insulae]RED49765.1 outer membrane protein OmpA-like peptidoglycan-associated protein [Aestuariispira insulae]
MMSVAKTLLSGTALALLISTGASLSLSGNAQAQTNYYWGTASFGEPVEVDLQALETLGPAPNLPQLLHPTQPLPAQPGSKTSAPEPRRVLPAAPSGQPKSSLIAPSAPRASQPTPARPSVAAKPQSTLVEPSSEMVKVSPNPAQPPKSTLVGEQPKTKVMAKPAKAPPKPELPDAPVVEKAAPPAPQPMKVEEAPEKEVSQPAETTTGETKTAAKPMPKPAKVEPPKAEPAPEPEQKTESAAPKPAETSPTPAKAEPAAEEPTVAENAPEKPAEESQPEAAEAKTEPAKANVVEEETQVAMIDPNLVSETENSLSIKFPDGISDLPAGVKPALDKLALRMESDEDLRVQLLGYAAAKGESPSQARRMSLFRALSVRTYLMKKGVRSTRMDVRALGSKVESGNPDRVDIVIPE